MELRLEDAAGRRLTERLHIFARAELSTPFAEKLVRNRAADADDDASQITRTAERPGECPQSPFDLVGETMTPPPANVPPQFRGLLKVNDGLYGDDYGWSDGWFPSRLFHKKELGASCSAATARGSPADRVRTISRSSCWWMEKKWETAFEVATNAPSFWASAPSRPAEIEIPPVEAGNMRR